MSRKIRIAVAVISIMLATALLQHEAFAASMDEADIESIVARALVFPKDISISADVRMTHYLENGEARTAQWKMWRSTQKQMDRMRLSITEPNEQKGSALVAVQKKVTKNSAKQIWYFDAGKNRNKEITGSKRLKSFLKSGFSLEEIAEDYARYSFYRPLSFSHVNGKNCRLLEGSEKPDLKKPGRRIRLWVAVEDFALVKVEYQDKKGRTTKILKAGNFQKMAGKMMPGKWELKHLKNETRTILNFSDMKIHDDMNDALFDEKAIGGGG